MYDNHPGGRTETARDCRRLREQLCEQAAPAGGAAGASAPGFGHGLDPDFLGGTPERPGIAGARAALGIAGTPAAADWTSRHMASCPDCAAFARRLELTRQALARPLSAPAIEPDPYFPARVLARIARPAELIGWAAFRALPAALGLALALAWLGLSAPASPAASPRSPLLDEPPSSEQLLAWSSLSPEVWP